ncbi:MAG TPA: hypothetical protein VH639_20705 [Bryobacteraceae bacterium]|jgi:hypothetical protein
MVLGSAVVLVVVAAVLFTLFVRKQDLPEPEPLSPTKHLEDRKAAIYENLRDLQFEYRVGKLSDADYQQTKLGLQRELAGVIGQIEQIGKEPAVAPPRPMPELKCGHCGAIFTKPMKFCGECGKAMA